MIDDESEIAELKAQALFGKRYRGKLLAHPDCRDPDHPGCKYCEPEMFGIEENNDDDQ